MSFDGFKFDHYGECEYTLVTPRTIGISGYPTFELKGKLSKNSPLETISFLRELTLTYQESTYQLKQKGVVLVNTERVYPPYSDAEGTYIRQTTDQTVSASNHTTTVFNLNLFCCYFYIRILPSYDWTLNLR